MDLLKDKLFFTDVRNQKVRSVNLTTGVISTVAGGGPGPTDGDGGPATEATFSTHPMRVAVDASGDLYITDAHNDRVRRVDAATGIISTYAGNGIEGYSGDGGPATAAGLAVPHAARFDTRGNLLIADTHSNRVRRVDVATGVITTIAGTGEKGYSGDGGPAVQARLNGPLSVVADETDNIYIIDCDNARLRRVDAASGLISSVAGCGQVGRLEDGADAMQASFGRLRDVLVAAVGRLIVCDGGCSTVFRLDLDEGTIRFVAGNGTDGFSGDGGPATAAQLNLAYSVAMDEGENLYIKDSSNRRIRRLDATTGIITTVAGNGDYGDSGDGGPALAASLGIG